MITSGPVLLVKQTGIDLSNLLGGLAVDAFQADMRAGFIRARALGYATYA